MNNLIDERDERTRKRKKIKRKMDSIIGLSYNDKEKHKMKLAVSDITVLADEKFRLLDEGYFDSVFVIKKGTMEKYLNGENQYVTGYELNEDGLWQPTGVLNLDSDFVGTVNIGHMDFATFPYLVGEWTKEDLSLVDIENDRKGIDVRKTIDESSIFVQELKRQPFNIGISAEFYYHVNEADTKMLSEMFGYYIPVIDEIFIFAYGLVGECGNVNSSEIELKGVAMSKDIEKLAAEQVEVELELENAGDVIEEINEVEEETKELGVEEIDITVNEEEAETEEEVEAEEEVIENSAEVAEEEEVIELADEEDSDEEDEVEEVEDDEEDLDDEDEVDEADELTEALSVIKDLKAQVAELTNRLADKDKKIRRLSKKIAVEKEAKARFLEETKNLSVELYENELEAKEAKEEELAAQKETKEYLDGGIADI